MKNHNQKNQLRFLNLGGENNGGYLKLIIYINGFLFFKPKPKIKQGNFPTHLVPKTDEERIQNIPYVLETYRDKRFVVSEKLDGSSITIIHDKGKLRICSRNYEVTGKKDNKFVQVVESINFKKHIDKLVETFGENVIVQGEFIGEPQGNKYELSNNEIRLFNIYVNGNRLPQDKFYNICFGLSIPTCPLITTFDNLNHFKSLDDILKYAENKSILNRKTEREGLVFRCIEDNLSFKVISNKFLIKNNE